MLFPLLQLAPGHEARPAKSTGAAAFLIGATLALSPFIASATAHADESTSPSATSQLSTWDGSFQFATVDDRPAHYAAIHASASATCPSSSAATKLTLELDPEDGIITPHPKDGTAIVLSRPIVSQGTNASWSADLALKGGAIYRLQAKASCCAAIASNGGCDGESEPVSVLSNELELPPTIDGVRALREGLYHGALLVDDQLDTSIYDSVPTPSWPRAEANMSKFVKFEGTGIDFKSKSYNASVHPITLTTLHPTMAGTLTATLTVKGGLYTPEGDFIRNYTLTSEPFPIPVNKERCVLDANINTFILEGEEPKCLDRSAYQPLGVNDLEESGCSTTQSSPIASLPFILLSALGLISLRRRRQA